MQGQFLPIGSAGLIWMEKQEIWKDTTNLSLRLRRLSGNSLSEMPYGRSMINVYRKEFFKLKLLPIRSVTELNSHYPFGWNNGALRRVRGFQQLLSVGAYLKLGVLEAQIQPEVAITRSRSYEWHSNEENAKFWRAFSRLSDRSGLALFNEDSSHYRIFPGQTDISISYWNQKVGASSKNLWWGPGREHSLTMTNNAPGFLHAYLKSTKPVDLGWMDIQYEIIAGKLDNIPYDNNHPFMPDSSGHLDKRQDWRYLSGINLMLQSKYLPGFSFGIIRTIQQYSETAFSNGEFLPFGPGLTRSSVGNFGDERDQQASLYFDWKLTQSKLRLYGEFGRNDSPQNIRDIAMSAFHSSGIVAGLSKQLIVAKNSFNWHLEYVRLNRSGTYLIRPEPEWYLNGKVRHGYTHKGDFIGSGLNWGSNAFHTQLEWVSQERIIGISYDQIFNYQDVQDQLNRGIRAVEVYPWIDYVPGAYWLQRREKITSQLIIKTVLSNNYFWNQELIVPGIISTVKNRANLFVQFNLSYQL